MTLATGTDETEAAPQSLHLNHFAFPLCVLFVWGFFAMYPHAPRNSFAAVSASERSALSCKARGQHCSQISPVHFRPQPLTPGTPASVQAPNTGPGATSRADWKELWAVSSSWSPGIPRKVLSESLLQNLEAAEVCTDGHCFPHGADSVVHWKSLPPGSPGREQTAQSSAG